VGDNPDGVTDWFTRKQTALETAVITQLHKLNFKYSFCRTGRRQKAL